MCAIIAFLLVRLLKSPGLKLLRLSGLVRQNYAGKLIPTSTGVVLVSCTFVATVTTIALYGLMTSITGCSLPCLMLVVGSSFIGLVDDMYGSHVSRGLTGHVKALVREGRVTTGLLKAGIVWLLAIVAVSLSSGVLSAPVVVMDAVLISLTANFMNLLDLRPLRSVKVFFIILGLLLAGDFHSPLALVPVGLAGSALAGAKDELNEECMLGDAGANPLGASLGYWMALQSSMTAKALVLFFLAGIHVYSERHSLSKTIDKNPVLRIIDRLGRS